MVERMVRHVQETVFLANQIQHAPRSRELRAEQRFPHRILQVLTPAVGKLHQILMVLVAPARQCRVKLVQRQVLHDFTKQVLRHRRVENHTNGLAVLAAFHGPLHFLQRPCIQLIVQFHFRVFRELE